MEGGPRRLLRLLGRHGGVREGGGVDIIDMGAASLAAVLFMECTGPGSDSQAPETALACSRCCQHHTHVPRASPPPCAPTQSQLHYVHLFGDFPQSRGWQPKGPAVSTPQARTDRSQCINTPVPTPPEQGSCSHGFPESPGRNHCRRPQWRL